VQRGIEILAAVSSFRSKIGALLEQKHIISGFRQQPRNRATSAAATHDDEVVLRCHAEPLSMVLTNVSTA
jgi:hypothetical protein